MMTGQRQPPAELTIGVVGPHDLVERVMLTGAVTPGQPGAGPGLARRLVAATYRSEQEAPDRMLRLGPAIDVFLFAGPVPLEYARRAGVLRVPATCVPLSGSALFAALLRARAAGPYDLSRVSVDVLSRGDVEDAFAELDVPAAGIHVREDPGGAAALAAFHERLWRRDQTSVAFTCLESVAQRLTAAGIPAFAIRPTGSAIRAALRTAGLLGAQRRLEEAQLAVAVVEVPTLRETARRPAPRQSQEELRLTVHRFLLQEAQRMQASVSPMGDHTFLVTATRGSLSGATDGFRVPPFSDRARGELGIAVEVGVGRAGRPRTRRRTHGPRSPAPTPGRAARAPRASRSTARGTRWSRRRARPPRPRRAGRRAWRSCPASPTSSPPTTARTSSTRRPPGGCSASRPAPPAGCFTPWSKRAWPGRCHRTGPRSPGARASSTGSSRRNWSTARPVKRQRSCETPPETGSDPRGAA
jgi:hypothetical protein